MEIVSLDIETTGLNPEKSLDTKTCLEIAGMDKEVSHNALKDARDVVELLWKKFITPIDPAFA